MLSAAERFPVIRVMRLRPFMIFWGGQFISQVGDSLYRLALGWQVLKLTGSATAMAVVLVVNILPSVLFSLVGGVLADRVPRRLILLVSDGGRGLVVAVVSFLVWFHLIQFWHLLILSLLFGIVDSFFFPAFQGIIPHLVDDESLHGANSLMQIGTLLSRVVGPPLALLCLATIGTTGAFVGDTFSFLCSVCSLVALRSLMTSPQQVMVEQSSQEQQTPLALLQDIREGWNFVRFVPWLWITILLASLGNIAYFAPIMTVLPRLVAYTGYYLLGVFSLADAIGGMTAALMIGIFTKIRRRGILAYLALLVSATSLVILGLPLPSSDIMLYFVLAGIASGIGLSIFEVVWSTLVQEKVPDTLLGRVSSIDWLGSNILLPIALVPIGLLADHIGPSSVLLVCGIVSLLLAIVGMAVPDIRRL